MSIDIDTRISPSLHPEVVRSINGYDAQNDEIMGVLSSTVHTFDTIYKAVQSVYTAREAARTNPTWNEAEQVIRTDDFMGKKLEPASKVIDRTLNDLTKNISQIENSLSEPVRTKASLNVAQEIRAYAKNLGTVERGKFMLDAINSGDEITATAILGAPPYLSGLNSDLQKTFTRMWHEHNTPGQALRLKIMIGAKSLLEKNAGLIFTEMEKAVGFVLDPKSQRKIKPHELRAAKITSEKAFKNLF